jgi:hypothetical protein
MYYVSFFPDFRPLVTISLIRLLENNNIENVWINQDGRVTEFTLEALPPNLDKNLISIPDVGELKSWHIYGIQNNSHNHEDFKFPSLNRISLEEIDALYEKISQKYLWCFLPWGNVGSFSGFAFVSSNKDIRDRFVDIVNELNLSIKYPNTPSRQPRCISSYNVDKKLSESIQCIIFDVNSYWLGMRAWKLAKQIDSRPPMLVINNLNYLIREDLSDFILDLNTNNDVFFQFSNNLTTDTNSSLLEIIKNTDDVFWDNFDGDFPSYFQKSCKEVATLRCFEESGEAANVFDVEQWDNQIYFNQVCGYYSNFSPSTEIIIPVPKINTLKSIETILAMIGISKYGTSDDLIMMPELLNQTEWFLGINRLLENGNKACIFMSKDNSIIQLFICANYNDNFSLISCF